MHVHNYALALVKKIIASVNLFGVKSIKLAKVIHLENLPLYSTPPSSINSSTLYSTCSLNQCWQWACACFLHRENKIVFLLFLSPNGLVLWYWFLVVQNMQPTLFPFPALWLLLESDAISDTCVRSLTLELVEALSICRWGKYSAACRAVHMNIRNKLKQFANRGWWNICCTLAQRRACFELIAAFKIGYNP